MALPAGRVPSSASATQVRRYQPPSGCGARPSAAMSDSPGRTPRQPGRASAGGDAEAGGDGERVRGGAAEERAIGGGPLDVEMASCSHVKPMPPKDWIDSRPTRFWQSSLAALAMETAVARVGVSSLMAATAK